jgi:hypothetical protein
VEFGLGEDEEDDTANNLPGHPQLGRSRSRMKSTSSDGSTQKMAHSMSRQLSTQISTQPSEKEKPDSKEEEEEEVFSIRSSDIEGLSGVEVRDIFVHIT